MRVKFGPWTPDQPDLDSGGLEECVNCLPLESGYGALRQKSTLSGTVTISGVVNSLLVEDPTGAYMFVGRSGANGLGRFFHSAGAASAQVSFTTANRTASYSASTTAWSFARFGSTVLATNGFDAMQVGSVSANFRDQSASASAPVARHLAVVRDFVFAGNIVSGGVGAGTNRVQWCQINNPQRWTPSPRAQSDSQDFPDTGDIIAMTGGDFAAILTERAVWRGTYVGSPVIFRFDQVAPDVACLVPASVARYQNLTFFLSTTGFQVFDGSQCIPIGSASIDKFALEFVDGFPSDSPTLRGIIDKNNKCYIASLRSGDSSNALLIYNFTAQRWSFIDLSAGAGAAGLAQITDSIMLAAGKADNAVYFPDPPLSYDTTQRLGIGAFYGGAYTEFYGGTTGVFMTATFATGEAQLFPDQRGFVKAVRPLIQGNSSTSITVEVGKRNKLNESVIYGAAVAVNANGVAPLRADARYHRVRVNVSGGFDRAIGFDLDATPAGKR